MKIIIRSITILLIISTAYFFFFRESDIVKSVDYSAYLDKSKIELSQENLTKQQSFWANKLKEYPENSVYMLKLAGYLSKGFKATGDVSLLEKSDSLLYAVNSSQFYEIQTLHALIRNSITQHQFYRANDLIIKAKEIKDEELTTLLMECDLSLEKGEIDKVATLLSQVSDKESFSYLIRAVKLNDQQGNLDGAIVLMERALSEARKIGSKYLINWSLSNLADMYGHQGEIQKSYDTYLEALTYNETDFHSLKGIAWIAFSNENNSTEAKKIIHFLKSVHPIPDYDLLLAKIAEFENNTVEKEKYTTSFLNASLDYGNMYMRYICLEYCENGMYDKALLISKNEVNERPNPVSYALNAWAYYKNGDVKKALSIINNHVLNKTEEPLALYQTAVICMAAGDNDKSKDIFLSLEEASFELGPIIANNVNQYLNKI